jgi:Asp-tRNA(Asn)/Glu-tRNA(Gln) amidotransferase A subunit family amidase
MSVATATELWRMSATELAEAIRTKQASSVEVVEAHLRRIDAVNPSINAIVIILGDQALEAAKVADHGVTAGTDLPPFHGVPFTIKEDIDLRRDPDQIIERAGHNPHDERTAEVMKAVTNFISTDVGVPGDVAVAAA